MTMLHHWLYVSSSRLARDDCELQVQHIANVSKRRNAACAVTGALLFSVDQFVQLIEGPPNSVAQIRASISQDLRHSDVITLADGELPERNFEGWALAYNGRSQFVGKAINKALTHFNESRDRGRNELLRLIKGLV